MADQPSQGERELAEAAAEIAVVAAAIARATVTAVYDSERRGPTPVSSMAPAWAENALKAGHTNSHDPAVHRALERRARESGK